jgi:hypothetical protein
LNNGNLIDASGTILSSKKGMNTQPPMGSLLENPREIGINAGGIQNIGQVYKSKEVKRSGFTSIASSSKSLHTDTRIGGQQKIGGQVQRTKDNIIIEKEDDTILDKPHFGISFDRKKAKNLETFTRSNLEDSVLLDKNDINDRTDKQEQILKSASQRVEQDLTMVHRPNVKPYEKPGNLNKGSIHLKNENFLDSTNTAKPSITLKKYLPSIVEYKVNSKQDSWKD